ncbi:hypothetical protein BJY01DRAFT_254676 [Aspergillus pseudoustus]|uniref:Uncharacterized protein n=1 Tax=Aspergillus pseudoustus TaxID=1810923 RepID=A0ABR4IRJ9_9EURO
MPRPKERPSKVKKSPRPASKRQKAVEEARKQIATVRNQEIEDSQFGPYGIVSWKSDESGTLEDQVRILKSVSVTWRSMSTTPSGTRNSWRGTFSFGTLYFRSIYRKNSKDSSITHGTGSRTSGVDADFACSRLASKQKQQVIASLNGYIV